MTASTVKPEQCQSHHWIKPFQMPWLFPQHTQCPSLATTDSLVPGGIRLRVCKACYDLRRQGGQLV